VNLNIKKPKVFLRFQIYVGDININMFSFYFIRGVREGRCTWVILNALDVFLTRDFHLDLGEVLIK